MSDLLGAQLLTQGVFGSFTPAAAHSGARDGDERELPEVPSGPSLRTSSEVASAATDDVVGARLTCTRCRRHFDAVFVDDHVSVVSLRDRNGGTDGACAAESVFLAAERACHAPAQLTSSALCLLPVAEVVELRRRRRETLAQQLQVINNTESRNEAKEGGEQKWKEEKEKEKAESPRAHASVLASVRTAAGAYHPLQPSLFSPWRVEVQHSATEPGHDRSVCSSDDNATATLFVSTRQPNATDKVLVARLSRSYGGGGFAWLASSAARTLYTRQRHAAWLAVLCQHLRDDQDHTKSQGQTHRTHREDACDGIGQLYEPPWRSHELRTLTAASPAVNTRASGGAPGTTQLSAAEAALEPLRHFPTPVAADALTVQSMDYQGRQEALAPTPAYFMRQEEENEEVDTTREATRADASFGEDKAGDPRHRRDAEESRIVRSGLTNFDYTVPFSPVTLAVRRQQKLLQQQRSHSFDTPGQGSLVGGPTESLHRSLWRLLASECGANLVSEPNYANTSTRSALRVLPPLCVPCWESYALARGQDTASATYADVADFCQALPPHDEIETATLPARAQETMSATQAPLWRQAVAALLEQSPPPSQGAVREEHDVKDLLSSKSVPTSSPPTTPMPDSEVRLHAELASLRTQRAALMREAEALTAQLGALDAEAHHDLQPKWDAAVRTANSEEVTAFTVDGVDEALGRCQQTRNMAQSLAFVQQLSLLRIVFSIDVNGPVGRIVGLRLGTVAPYNTRTATATRGSQKTDTASVSSASHDGLVHTHGDDASTVVRPFLLPHVDADVGLRTLSLQTDELREALTFEARQTLLAQPSLSGAGSGGGGEEAESPIAPAETNAACGYLLALVNHLAKANGVVFSRAELHPRGEASVVDIVKSLPSSPPSSSSSPPRRAGSASGGSGVRDTSAAPSSTGWFAWARGSTVAAGPAPVPSNATASSAAATTVLLPRRREVVRTVDFHLKTNLLGWKTFGAGCVEVLGCVKELCEHLSDALRAWRRQQLLSPFSITGTPLLTRESTSALYPMFDTQRAQRDADPEEKEEEEAVVPRNCSFPRGGPPHMRPHGHCTQTIQSASTSPSSPPRASPLALVDAAGALGSSTPTKTSSLLSHAQVSVTLDAPFVMGVEGTVQGFSVQHGTVSDAVWSLAMKKLLANVLWCAQATAELQRLREP